MDFADVISPISTQDFVKRHLYRNYLVLPGHASRFSALVPWDDLNEMLQSQRVSGKRLRLLRDGVEIPPTRYLNEGAGSLMNAQATARLLRDGATMNVNGVDELFPALRALAESCEDEFRIPVQANLYAAWRIQKALNLHWDEHDTLVLQVAGRKKWEVYAPTRLHPIQHDVTGTPRRPTTQPVWSGILDEGALLYMPRGWWHVACPIDAPTLHVTIGLRHPRGIDLMRWLGEEMLVHLVARMPLPHLDDPHEQASYATSLRQCLADAITEDVVERFMRAADRKARPRPRFELPDAVASAEVTVGVKSILRLLTARKLHCQLKDDGRLAFEAGTRAWTCDARLRPALEMLRQGRGHSFSNLSDSIPSELETPLRLFIEMLAMAGVIAVSAAKATARV